MIAQKRSIMSLGSCALSSVSLFASSEDLGFFTPSVTTGAKIFSDKVDLARVGLIFQSALGNANNAIQDTNLIVALAPDAYASADPDVKLFE